MSPMQIKVALHYYCHPFDYCHDKDGNCLQPEVWGSVAMAETVRVFLYAALLRPNPRVPPAGKVAPVYIAGPALETYVRALEAVPFPVPVQQWVIPGV